MGFFWHASIKLTPSPSQDYPRFLDHIESAIESVIRMAERMAKKFIIVHDDNDSDLVSCDPEWVGSTFIDDRSNV